jgi:carbon-monoxide dehydrogenase medium subunit
LKHFDYVAAHSVADALGFLAENSPDALPIAGGTDLLVRVKRGQLLPKMVVDIAGIREMQGIKLTEAGLRIGSMVSHAEIISSPLINKHAPVLAAASGSVGAPQTRTLGTVGGNLTSCVPSMDCAPPLLVLEALVKVAQRDGEEQIPLEEFLLGSKRCSTTPDRLLIEILIPLEHLGKGSSFAKFGRRKALTLALVNAAARVDLDSSGRSFACARLALGAVAPTPIRAHKAEDFLEGKPASEDVLAEAGVIASGEADPISDLRASAKYRLELIKVLTRRVLKDAINGQTS